MFRYAQILILIVFSCTNAWSRDIFVGPAETITSISDAISTALNGDKIIVREGTYKEGQIIVDKELRIIGEGMPVVDGEHNNEIFTIEADNVEISGFRIQNVGTSFIKDRAAIKVESQKNCLFENNEIYDAFFGIYLVRAKNCTIQNNTIIGKAVQEAFSGNAIQLWYSHNIVVKNNTCTQHRDGIYIEFSRNCKFSNNISSLNVRYGLHFMYSDSCSYSKNTFRENSAGVAVMFSNYISMNDNLFVDNWGPSSYGLLLKEIKDSKLVNNEFLRNTIGIYAEGTNRVLFEYNNFTENGWALKIKGSCESNRFTRNNFFSNTFEMSTESRNMMGNVFESNYWSEYTGYDLNHDGVGDVPHKPVNLFSYIVEKNPSTLILLRSLFIDILNLAEKIAPVITPEVFNDEKPLMQAVQW